MGVVIGSNEYGEYFIPESSMQRPAAMFTINGDVYEPGTLVAINANCSNGDVVHAGAYFGDMLPAISSFLDEGRVCWSVEPNRENYNCAKATLKLNNIDNVILYRAALDVSGSRTPLLKTKDEFGNALGGMSKVVGGAAVGTYERVSTTTIDEIVPSGRWVSVIHLDVEGYETRALIGAKETIERCHPTIIIEGDTSHHLEHIGYEKKYMAHHNSVWARKE